MKTALAIRGEDVERHEMVPASTGTPARPRRVVPRHRDERLDQYISLAIRRYQEGSEDSGGEPAARVTVWA